MEEKQKRIYPGRPGSRLISGVLLMITALVILSGVISREQFGHFSLEKQPSVTAVPLDESFDETMTEMTVDLAARTWFALQMGAFEGEESAKQSAIAFQKRGAAGYLWQDGRYRVLAAAYPDRDDAQSVREQLRDQHNIDSYLYVIEFPSITMRLTGMQGQLEILQAAFGHANDLAVQIQSVSAAMDRQELSGQEALAQLQSARVQTDLVALRLEQRFSKPVHETVQTLIDCFNDYAAFVSELVSDESAVTLGVKLKYQTFVTLQNIQKVYQTLNHT